jgi:RimJ/RimL family protein N-acetyltransferase
MFSESITTDRLSLRLPQVEDAAEVFSRYASNPEVTRNLSWKTHASPAETRDFLQLAAQWRESGAEFDWVICDRSTGEIWGMIAVRPKLPRVEIGYVLAREQWGKGITTEAVRAVVAAIWHNPAVWRIEAHCALDNVASARVLEKSGFALEGIARKFTILPNRSTEPLDVKIYASVRDL